ncbi:hypothetical protein BP6252_03773 [Coleophoma cylindrospora]|uniref:PDZ domain-containing protein n=1 Tax=Coleophoma cylindrospora TaxID=1849047 RepID=A0A3D8S945_9HELO|nr:hypothetical protein BP6252_03773 [Coleophoma cylindrospora]
MATTWSHLTNVQRAAKWKHLTVKAMINSRHESKPYGLQQWFELLGPLMGDEGKALFTKMEKGEVFVFPEQAFGAKIHRMIEYQWGILDFGMDRNSFAQGPVKDLEKGSRAEQAGLKEGDILLN